MDLDVAQERPQLEQSSPFESRKRQIQRFVSPASFGFTQTHSKTVKAFWSFLRQRVISRSYVIYFQDGQSSTKESPSFATLVDGAWELLKSKRTRNNSPNVRHYRAEKSDEHFILNRSKQSLDDLFASKAVQPTESSVNLAGSYSRHNLLQTDPVRKASVPIPKSNYSSTVYPISELEGLYLDAMKMSNMNLVILQISKDIGTKVMVPGDAANQVRINRAWKILLLGLSQTSSLGRRAALAAIGNAVATINDTLLESYVVGRLVLSIMNIIGSDENFCNRLKAIDIAGLLARRLGQVQEHQKLLQEVFLFLAKKMLHVHLFERRSAIDNGKPSFTAENRKLKISLIKALGNFTMHESKFLVKSNAFLLYMIHQEFQNGDVRLPDSESTGSKTASTDKSEEELSVHVVYCLLSVLNHSIKKDRKNTLVMNLLFGDTLLPLMTCQYKSICTSVATFFSTWNSRRNGYSSHSVAKIMLDACTLCKKLAPDCNFASKEFDLREKILDEERRIILRGSYIRKLLAVPGTFIEMNSVPEEPGVFMNLDAKMLHSTAAAIHLPVAPFCKVTLHRIIPNIPGVPDGCSTTPPIFAPEGVNVIVESPLDFLESTGYPEIPVGTSYLPFARVHNMNKLRSISSGEILPYFVPDSSVSQIVPALSNPSESANLPVSIADLLEKVSLASNNLVSSSTLLSDLGMSAIPDGYHHAPPRNPSTVSSTAPNGMLSTCPFIGFNPENYAPTSSIIHAPQRHVAIFSKISNLEADIAAPTGFTFDRHPILWPAKNQSGMKSYPHVKIDFTVGAPVLIEVLNPETAELQLALCNVTSINRDLPMKVVHNLSGKNAKPLINGSSYHLFFRSRYSKSWSCAELTITNEDYSDTFVEANESLSDEHFDKPAPIPLPAGYNLQGEPYFAPPVNLPPIPVSYIHGIPVYEKSLEIKPAPFGITLAGTRFYLSESEEIVPLPVASQIAGFDNNGDPFYLPRGASVPPPAGFTPDGIPYYNIRSVLHAKDAIVRPHDKGMSASDFLGRNPEEYGRAARHSMLSIASMIFSYQSDLKTIFYKHLMSYQKSTGQFGSLEFVRTPEFLEPSNILSFLMKMTDSAIQKPNNSRFQCDNSVCDFLASKTPVSRNVAIKYRSARHDRIERDFFLFAEPHDIFSVKKSRLRLAGDNSFEIHVTFNPLAIDRSEARGSLGILDDMGNCLFKLNLRGLKTHFISVSTTAIDFGWTMPEKAKETAFTITNLTANEISVVLETRHTRIPFGHSSGFSLLFGIVQLQPSEVKIISVAFFSKFAGLHLDFLDVYAPGSDVLSIPLSINVGLPIQLYPENDLQDVGCADAKAMSRLRTQTIQKFYKDRRHAFAKKNKFLNRILSIPGNPRDQRLAHTLNFDVCRKAKYSRFVTFVNHSDRELTFCLNGTNPVISFPLITSINPKSAETLMITVDMEKHDDGDFNEIIELVCSEIGTVTIYLKGFVGQPLFIPSYPLVFLPPCVPGHREVLTLPVINASQFPISFAFVEVETSESIEESKLEEMDPYGNIDASKGRNVIDVSLSLDTRHPIVIEGHSMMPVTFTFSPMRRGIYGITFGFEIIRPFKVSSRAALLDLPFQLYGISLDPSLDLDDGEFFQALKTSLSEGFVSSIPDLQARIKAKKDRFICASHQVGIPGVLVEPKILIFRSYPDTTTNSSIPEVDAAFLHKRAGYSKITLTHQEGDDSEISILSTPNFVPMDEVKTLKPNEKQSRDITFYAKGAERCWEYVHAYGFGLIYNHKTPSFESITFVAKPALDLILLPLRIDSSQLALDFGEIEMTEPSASAGKRVAILYNSGHTPYAWSVKISAIQRSKPDDFTCDTLSGELQPFESTRLVFTMMRRSPGTLTCVAELYTRPLDDSRAKSSRWLQINLYGKVLATAFTVSADSLNFGIQSIGQAFSHAVAIVNSSDTKLRVNCALPSSFEMKETSFIVGPKGILELDLTFLPTAPGRHSGDVIFFVNGKIHRIAVTAISGASALSAPEYPNSVIDFGSFNSGMLSWRHLYLRNDGVLPLCISSISTGSKTSIVLKYVGSTPMPPYDVECTSVVPVLTRNFWKLVKLNLRAIISLSGGGWLISHNHPDGNARYNSFKSLYKNSPEIPLVKGGKVFDMRNSLSQTLKPLHLHHFLIGIGELHKNFIGLPFENVAALEIRYFSVLNDNMEVINDPQSFVLRLKAKIRRPLEITPVSHDFQCSAANLFAMKRDGEAENSQKLGFGITKNNADSRKSSTRVLEVINHSLTTQFLKQRGFSSTFVLNGSWWRISPGQKIYLPVEFQPVLPQICYSGEIHLDHDATTRSIHFEGVGASSNIYCDPVLDWGRVAIGSTTSKSLRLLNRGLLESPVILEIFQAGHLFSFASPEPHEQEFIMKSGEAIMVDVNCNCMELQKKGNPFIRLSWKQTLHGKWEINDIPLVANIGVPGCKINASEIDFGTIYLHNQKKVSLYCFNDGNAACDWQLECSHRDISFVTPKSGELQPRKPMTITLLFTPSSYDPLSTKILLKTGAGVREIDCFGVSGVPYLSVPPDLLNVDFGIIRINNPEQKKLTLTNTGPISIEFQASITNFKRNDIDCPMNEFDEFTISPGRGVLGPMSDVHLTIQATPSAYNSTISASLTIRSQTGEVYYGKISATGGKAIISISANEKAESVLSKPIESLDDSVNSIVEQETRDHIRQMANLGRQLLEQQYEKIQDAISVLRIVEIERVEAYQADRNRELRESRNLSRSSILRNTIEGAINRRKFVMPAQITALNANGESASKSDITQEPEYTESSVDEKYIGTQTAGNQSRLPSRGYMSIKSDFYSSLSNISRQVMKGAISYMTSILESSHPLETTLSIAPEGSTLIVPKGMDHESRVCLEELEIESTRMSEILINFVAALCSTEAGAGIDAARLQIATLGILSNRLTALSQEISKELKAHLTGGWNINHDLILDHRRILQESSALTESAVTTTISHFSPTRQAKERRRDHLSSPIFDIGLYRTGFKSEVIYLFSLPNAGNIETTFMVKPLDDESLRPANIPGSSLGRNTVFEISPESGVVKPGESIIFQVTFLGEEDSYYHEGYELVSEDGSVISFWLKAKSGTPKIEVLTPLLDFGLIRKRTVAEKTLVIANTGTYQDSWALSTAHLCMNETEMEAPLENVFLCDIKEGTLHPGQKISIRISFSTSTEGSFNQMFTTAWSLGDITGNFQGVGGSSHLNVEYQTDEDVQFSGLFLGVCIMGLAYTKGFNIKNVGNVEGIFDIALPSPCYELNISKNHDGKIYILPGQSLSAGVVFRPDKTELLKDNLVINSLDEDPANIQVQARCGFCAWNVQELLDIPNVQIGEVFSVPVKIENTGSLEIPLSLTLEPDYLEEFITLRVDNIPWQPGSLMAPSQIISADVVISPTRQEMVTGTVLVETNLGRGQVVKALPFQFFAFKDRVVLNDNTDMDVGCILVGENYTVSRTIFNYGRTPILYRTRLFTDDHPEIRTPVWTLSPDSEGKIPKEDSTGITFLFACVDEFGGQPQIADVIIETSESEDGSAEWKHVAKFRLQGTGGNPKLELEPETIEFGEVPMHTEMIKAFTLLNNGTASLRYDISELLSGQPEGSSIYTIKSNSHPLKGMLKADSHAKFNLVFKPVSEETFVADVVINTPMGEFKIHVTGDGYPLKLKESLLPSLLDFGIVFMGQMRELNINIQNDCISFLLVSTSIVDAEGVELPIFSVSPGTLRLGENDGLHPDKPQLYSASATISFFQAPPLAEDGTLDANAVQRLLYPTINNATLVLSLQEGGTSYRIPVRYGNAIRQAYILPRKLTEGALADALDELDAASIVTEQQQQPQSTPPTALVLRNMADIDFGEVNPAVGVSHSIFIHNPNYFGINFQVAITDSVFKAIPASGSLNLFESREIQVTFQPVPETEDVLPDQENHSCGMEISTNLDAIGTIYMDLYGVYVVGKVTLRLPPSLDFGVVLKTATRKMEVEIANSSKKMVEWRAWVDQEFADIYTMEYPQEGSLKPGASIPLKVFFTPMIISTYSTVLHIEFDEQFYDIFLFGQGQEMVAELDVDAVDFGIVGTGAAESRPVELYNPTDLEIRMQLDISPSSRVSTEDGEITLGPGERRHVHLIFDPSGAGQQVNENMKLYRVNTPGDPDAAKVLMKAITIQGVGGHFDFGSFSPPRTPGTPSTDYAAIAPEESKMIIDVDIPVDRLGHVADATFEIENTGDTVLDIELLDEFGIPLSEAVAARLFIGPADSLDVASDKLANVTEGADIHEGQASKSTDSVNVEKDEAHDCVPSELEFDDLMKEIKKNLNISPIMVKIPPKQTQMFNVKFMPTTSGEHEILIYAQTRNLRRQRRVPIRVKTSVPRTSTEQEHREKSSQIFLGKVEGEIEAELSEEVPGLSQAEQATLGEDLEKSDQNAIRILKSAKQPKAALPVPDTSAAAATFAGADQSVVHPFDYVSMEDMGYPNDQGIWKVLLPVVRVNHGLPSLEITHIAAIEPSVALQDIFTLLVRPPAIPGELSLAVDKKKKGGAGVKKGAAAAATTKGGKKGGGDQKKEVGEEKKRQFEADAFFASNDTKLQFEKSKRK